MKRFFAVFLILLLPLTLYSSQKISFPHTWQSQSELAYPDCSLAQTHDDLVALCGKFLDAYEPEILGIYNLMLQWEDIYWSVEYCQFIDQRIYYYVNRERSNSWEELPFQEELLAFRDRFQCTHFLWDRDGQQRDLGPSLVLQLAYARDQYGDAVGNLIYCPEDPPDEYVTGSIYEVPGHSGWYEYVILEE